MTVYYPRWALNLAIPVAGSASEKKSQDTQDTVVRWTMPVQSFRFERNDHTQADVLEVTVDWAFAGLDPRMLTDGTCTFFFGNATDGGAWAPSRTDLRFSGIMRRARVGRAEGGAGMPVELLFHDNTSLFLAEKPFVSAGLPSYSQTLSEAWARICDHVGPTGEDGQIKSVVSALRNVAQGDGAGLVFEGQAKDVVLGKAVAARFKGDPIGKEITDAWAVWQQCVGMVGLISYVRLDQVVVTTATDYYSEQASPRFIYGRNIRELSEERDVGRSREGIIVTSFDPMTGTTVEAFWPPIGDTSVRKKHLSAKKKNSQDKVLQAENRIAFAVRGVTDEGTLLDIARRIYEERSRQEFVGRLSTGELFVPRSDGLQFDVCNLGAGEVIRVEVDQEMLRTILGIAGDDARVERLLDYGYVEDVARVLVKNLARYSSLSPKFFTRRVITSADSTPEGGSFEVQVEFCNRINVDGSAT